MQGNQFAGISSLRKDEKKEPSVQNKALQEYLKRYTSGAEAGEKKKKRKKKPAAEQGGAVQIVDTDVTGFEAVQAAAERKRAAADAPLADDGSGDE